MIKFLAGAATAWILITNPAVPAKLITAFQTVLSAVVDALRASGRVG